jgi:ABC-2 type transport system ATP-binding protein
VMLEVTNLCKRYEKFELKDVSFSLGPGYIMGFVGKNGAGKTTTLKTMLNLVHKDGGSVRMFGRDFIENELEIKQRISYTFGGIRCYPKKTIGAIADVFGRFYGEWDHCAFSRYLSRFELDAGKKVDELSDGMKVKFNLALALSHNAKLLILDEPLSGLDPVSRDDLLELFQELIEDGDRSILFSTHITSDLEKCADYVTFIQDGRIVESRAKDDLIETYRVVKGSGEQLAALSGRLIGYKKNAFGFTGLVKAGDVRGLSGVLLEAPTLEEIMIYYDKRGTEK